MDNFRKFLNSAFGKEQDKRTHALAMLILYGIFLAIVIVILRSGNTTVNEKEIEESSKNSSSGSEILEEKEDSENVTISNDINYSYSYNIKYDNDTEIYLGKKVDSKEKFSYIKDGIALEYAIIGDNYLIMEDKTYHITSSLDTNFKYCDMEKILELIDELIPNIDGNTYIYNVTNSSLATIYSETLKKNNMLDNIIKLELDEDNLKSVSLDFSNYISSLLDENHSLIINMEFADIGTTENFDIEIG